MTSYIRTKELREKMSKLHKGKTYAPNTTFKKGHKQLNTGRTHFAKGKICHNPGELSNLWKGGITPVMRYLRTCTKYRQWRSDVFTRDNYTCIWCGVRSGNGKAVILQADHIKPFYLILEEYKLFNIEEALNCEELWNINNGRTLCENCHKRTETWGRPKK